MVLSQNPPLASVQVMRPPSQPIAEHPEFRIAQKYFQKLGSFRPVPTRRELDQSGPEGRDGGP